MQHIMVMGAGKIGSYVSRLLSSKYKITLADLQNSEKIDQGVNLLVLDASDPNTIISAIKKHKIDAVISCLPHFITKNAAYAVIEAGKHYFDLTEDVATSKIIIKKASNASSLVVPQCGLAPGFVSIVAQHLMSGFDNVEFVKMRVGALPMHVSNALQYALTWSTDGLINEYIQDTLVLRNSKKIIMPGLSGLETLKIDGLTYEAFHTSGGVGNLVNSCVDKVKNLDYKTIRYPGHCEKMNFLLKHLQLEHHPSWMKQILENAIPQTNQDMVLVYVSVTGKKDSRLMEKHYSKKFYPVQKFGRQWSAIQQCTASSVCAVVDLLLSGQGSSSGVVHQEEISYKNFIASDFGHIFDPCKE